VFTRHGREDGKALFCAAGWRGWQAPGKAREQAAHRFWINNVRANIFWQNQSLDQDNDFVQDRYPHPFVEMHPDDMVDLGLNPGDLLEIINDNGVTQGMAYPMPTLKRNTVAMVFGSPAGSQGNVVNPGVNELVLPDYKHCWGDIRKISDATAQTRGISFKSHEIML
jgi:arsenite oxidase large subunit